MRRKQLQPLLCCVHGVLQQPQSQHMYPFYFILLALRPLALDLPQSQLLVLRYLQKQLYLLLYSVLESEDCKPIAWYVVSEQLAQDVAALLNC